MRTANLLLVCSLVGLLTTPVSAQAKGGLGAVFGGLIGAAVGKAVGKAIATPESIEQALRKMSDQVNKQMPKVIDRDTRLDNIVAGPGARFSYNYTITSASSRDVDRPALLDANLRVDHSRFPTLINLH